MFTVVFEIDASINRVYYALHSHNNIVFVKLYLKHAFLIMRPNQITAHFFFLNHWIIQNLNEGRPLYGRYNGLETSLIKDTWCASAECKTSHIGYIGEDSSTLMESTEYVFVKGMHSESEEFYLPNFSSNIIQTYYINLQCIR